MGILSHALKLNPYLTHLNLENNQFHKGDKFYKITVMLQSNKILKSINLSKCSLEPEDAEVIGKGLLENDTLTSLNLSKNKIKAEGAAYIFDALRGKDSKVKVLDLSGNNIKN